MKVKMSRKYLGSLAAALALSVVLSGCGQNDVQKMLASVDDAKIESDLQTGEEETQHPDIIVERMEEVTPPVVEAESVIPNIGTYTGDSLIEALDSNGYKSSFEYRKEIAEYMYISNYEGTEAQNKYLLEVLKEYALAIKEGRVEETTVQSESYKVPVVYEWRSINDDFEYKFDENGQVMFRNHAYGEYTLSNGETYEKRECTECGHKQYREIETVKKQ